MPEIVHRIGIRAPVPQVLQALATTQGVAGWWTRHTSGTTGPGGVMTTAFHNPQGEEIGRFVIETLPPENATDVRWRVKEGPAEWVNTDISFALSSQDGQTIVHFAHRHWPDAEEFMAHCSMKWATFLLSLRALVEEGKGRPAPDDLKIDNWN